MLKHTISYCNLDPDCKNCKNCKPSMLKDKSIIVCADCPRDEGVWFYEKGRKSLIPCCNCPILAKKLNLPEYDVCGLTKKKTKKNYIFW